MMALSFLRKHALSLTLGTVVIAGYAIGHSNLLENQQGRLGTATLIVLAYLLFSYLSYSRTTARHAFHLSHAGDTEHKQHTQQKQQKPILIAYASQTGYAEQLARQTALSLHACGVPVQMLNLDQLDLQKLKDANRILLLLSTTGEGDAPDSAAAFARRLMSASHELAHLHYGLLALGDSSYAQFCAFAHRVDSWLQHQGASRLFDTIEVDNGDEGALRHWQHHLGNLSGHTEMADWSAPAYTNWTLTERRLLNPGSSGGPVYHLALTAKKDTGSAHWQAGDIAEIGPRNSTTACRELLASLQLDGNSVVLDDSKSVKLANALTLRLLPQNLLSQKTAADSTGNATQMDLLKAYTAQQLCDALPKLPHREYSIASIPEDGSLELLVRQTRTADGRLGLGSGWLTEHALVGDDIALRIRENRSFHAPETDRPMILIGNGTGLAGLRAHLKQRALKKQHRNWLLFGERSSAHDLFHAQELQQWSDSGVLTKLDLVFSRDQEEKSYVQDRLLADADRVRLWLADGAAIYVCGSLQGMASGVNAALQRILGAEALEELAEQGRYKRDVY